MAEHVFSNKSLVGKLNVNTSIANWYEDRLIKEQAFKKYADEFIVLSLYDNNVHSYATKNKPSLDFQAHICQNH